MYVGVYLRIEPKMFFDSICYQYQHNVIQSFSFSHFIYLIDAITFHFPCALSRNTRFSSNFSKFIEFIVFIILSSNFIYWPYTNPYPIQSDFINFFPLFQKSIHNDWMVFHAANTQSHTFSFHIKMKNRF